MASPKPERQLLDITEETLLRQHITSYLDVMRPVFVLVASLSLFTHLPIADAGHLRHPTILGAIAGFLGLSMLKLALTADDRHLASVVRAVEVVLLGARLVVHAVFILYRAETMLGRLITMLWLPLSAAKSCHSGRAYAVYSALHFSLVLIRFGADWEAGLPWLLTTAFISKMQLKWVQQQSEQHKLRLQLASALTELERVAKATTEDIFNRLCDASVALDADGCVAQPAPQLAAMLGRAGDLQGRPFHELVHADDVPNFKAVFEHDGEQRGQEVRHLQLRVCDAFRQAVPVHLFHARFQGLDHKPVLLFGISESWQPPKQRDSGLELSTLDRGTQRDSRLELPTHHECHGPLGLDHDGRSASARRPLRGAPRGSSAEKQHLPVLPANACKAGLSPRSVHSSALSSKKANGCHPGCPSEAMTSDKTDFSPWTIHARFCTKGATTADKTDLSPRTLLRGVPSKEASLCRKSGFSLLAADRGLWHSQRRGRSQPLPQIGL